MKKFDFPQKQSKVPKGEYKDLQQVGISHKREDMYKKLLDQYLTYLSGLSNPDLTTMISSKALTYASTLSLKT